MDNIIEIRVQTYDVSCNHCGVTVLAIEAEWDRIELDSGGFGQIPYCQECYQHISLHPNAARPAGGPDSSEVA